MLGQAVRRVQSPPPVWVQMATAHRYGDPPDRVCDEDAAFGYGLAPFVGQAWERCTLGQCFPRCVRLSCEPVLCSDAAAAPCPGSPDWWRWGLGGRVGHGRQGTSWIHQQDMNRLMARAISDRSMTGAYLATAPNPVSNGEFMRELRRVLRAPFGLPTANWMVRLGGAVDHADRSGTGDLRPLLRLALFAGRRVRFHVPRRGLGPARLVRYGGSQWMRDEGWNKIDRRDAETQR